MVRFDTDSSQPGAKLTAQARQFATIAGFEDPAIEAALEQGIREQVTAQTERSQQAAGLTGASQVAFSGLSRASALAEAATTAQAQRIQRQQSLLELEQRALGQAAQVNEQRYKTNLQHQQFVMQMKMQKDQQRSALAGALGGAVLGMVGGGGLSGLFGGGASEAAAGAGAAFAPTEALGGELFMGASGVQSALEGTMISPAWLRQIQLGGSGFNI